MSPIDRVAQRAQAFTVLGVAASATLEDIRQAYKKLAFEKHPDHNPDATSEFARITEAYQFVTDNAAELGVEPGEPANKNTKRSFRPKTMPSVNRPQVKATETNFDDATVDECKLLLENEGGPGTLHAATSVYRSGRSLTYYVPTPLAPGRNEVAVPTGMLVDSRYVLPKIVAFDARETTGGLFDMDLQSCKEHFPGARSIKIRFASA